MKKILKTSHILLANILKISCAVLLIMVIFKSYLAAQIGYNKFDLIVYYMVNTILNYSFFAIIVTAFLYAIFTPWGFFNHQWIVVKWILAISGFLVYWFKLGPAVNGLVAISDAGIHLTIQNNEYQLLSKDLLIFSIIQIIIFALLFLISRYKPGKKISNVNLQKKKLAQIIVIILLVFGVFSLVMQTVMMHSYRNMAIKSIDLKTISNGRYLGSAEFYGFEYKIALEIKNHKIIMVDIINNRDNNYAHYAEGVKYKIIKAGNINIDGITGATTTSKCLLKAAENAFQK